MCTKEELFKKNYKFAFWFVDRNFPTLVSDDDIKQEALLGLWKACCIFDQSKGKFTTIATRCINNTILTYLRKSYNNSRLIAAHLEDAIPGYDKLTVADAIVDPNWEVGFNRAAIEEAMEKLTSKQRSVVDLKLQGLSQREIAKVLGLSQTYVSNLMRAAAKNLKS